MQNVKQGGCGAELHSLSEKEHLVFVVVKIWIHANLQ